MSGRPLLKLRAEDAEDLAVVAACLQDALVRLDRMTFHRCDRCFSLVLDRFRWEAVPGPPGRRPSGRVPVEQVTAGLRFGGVRAVRVRGLDQTDRTGLLELLSVMCGSEAQDAAASPGRITSVTLIFAGGGEIRLELEGLICHLEDLGVPRRSPHCPEHRFDDAGQASPRN